ncbi:helix-turn-helix transcriptional regulator [Caenispirillum bisanense]|uniref:helix-turn-helix domain-containing protein n=1 Tax=Caenispirillum bisanense TaxID=414052 RepID=UPI0031D52433
MIALAGVPDRLRSLRESRKVSQKEMAATVGASQRAWADYEGGRTLPGAGVLAALAEQGVDLHWLLLGQGSMQRQPSGGLDEDLLRLCLERVEQALASRASALEAGKKALLVKEIYMLTLEREAAGEGGRVPSEDLVARFVRLAS